jgi:nucleoside-triphosphatase
MKSSYLLTGRPGTGKTSLIKQAVSPFKDKAGGFYTEEIRLQGARHGFRIVTLDGQMTRLAHIGLPSPFKISRYGVDIEELETVGVVALQKAAARCDIVVIDEIGRMEIVSDKFKAVVLEIIDSSKMVLGTIMLKSDPWVDKIKQKPQVQLITVTRNNHREVLKQIEEWLCQPNSLK